MNRVLRLVVVLLVTVATGFADGADDAFIRIYNLIQQADSHREIGHLTEARDAYSEAKDGLLVIQRNYPAWNERVISYRLRYVGEKLDALKGVPAKAVEPAAAKPSAPSTEVAPNGEVLTQFEQLNGQIRQLSSEKQLLEAKLREALIAQPAPVDPKEFQTALDRINSLQTTNKALMGQIEQQQTERRNLVDKVVADEAREALNEANRKLLEQKIAAGKIEKEKADVEAKLKGLQDGSVKALQTENSALKQQVSELKTDTERGKQVAELAGKLSRLQTDLDDFKKRNDTLTAEKAALERQLEDLRARSSEDSILKIKQLETSLAAAKSNAERSNAEAEQIALALAKEKQVRGDLEMANKSLLARVDELSKSSSASSDAVKVLQSTLAAERIERDALLSELKAAEQKLADVAAAGNGGAAVAAGKASDSANLKNEVAKLRSALKDGAERETELRAALRQEEEWKTRFLREKADLEKRLAAALDAPAAAMSAKSPENMKTLAKLESKVRDLEKERNSLRKKLDDLAKNAQARLATGASWRMVTPRERAEQFNNRPR